LDFLNLFRRTRGGGGVDLKNSFWLAWRGVIVKRI
jgi:hypothetical protein